MWSSCSGQEKQATQRDLPSPRWPLQVLYPTLSDYDIRYYVMEILKVRAAAAAAAAAQQCPHSAKAAAAGGGPRSH